MDGEAELGAYDLLMIHQLLAYYGHVVDDRDWNRFGELFTPDATLDYTRAGADRVFHGVEEIRAFFRDANHPSAHHVLNIVVTQSGGEVRVRSKFFVPYTREPPVPKRWLGGDSAAVVARPDPGGRSRSRASPGRGQSPPDEEPIPPHRRT